MVKVSDGDTIWIRLHNGNRVKVRVWGIDTPEKFRSKKLFKEARRCGVEPAAIVRLGKLASRQAKELLDHSRVELIPRGRGRYGRLLAVVILPDGEDFGRLMIETVYACIYRKNAPPEYRAAQRRAARERKGLWSVDSELMRCVCNY